MLTKTSKIIGYELEATDGDIGKVTDAYFDDESWALQYFVADTGGWLTGRKVLISPQSVGTPDWEDRMLPVGLTRKQIEESPPIDEHEPVSRKAQLRLATYFGWGAYWTAFLCPSPEVGQSAYAGDEDLESGEDQHLRSLNVVSGYAIQAADGQIGHVEDFIAQTDDWVLRYMLVDTRDWLPGKKVLVSPAWITQLDWVRAHVQVDLPLETIRGAPEFDPKQPLDRDYESRLFEYYKLPPYWKKEVKAHQET